MLIHTTVALILLAPLNPGAPVQDTQVPQSPSAARAEWRPGVVFVIEGVGGFTLFNHAVRWAVPHAGLGHEVREFVWTHGTGKILRDLQDTRHLLRKADELAAEIRKVKADDPDRPVFVVAKSGGTGLTLAAVEQLPPQTLERIILVSAAVSPSFDLRPALKATKREIISFYSPFDQLVLRWGTRLFGTVDRVYGPSAGLRGFAVPTGLSEADQAMYDRVVQVRWHPTMLLEGNPGVHSGTSMPFFVARQVAPWLRP